MGRRMHVWPVRLNARPVQWEPGKVKIHTIVKDGTRPLVLELDPEQARRLGQSVLDAAAEASNPSP